jgi:hypothetical protein
LAILVNRSLDPLLAAYRRAKADHESARRAVRSAGKIEAAAVAELVARQSAAERAEFHALATLLHKPRAPLRKGDS